MPLQYQNINLTPSTDYNCDITLADIDEHSLFRSQLLMGGYDCNQPNKELYDRLVAATGGMDAIRRTYKTTEKDTIRVTRLTLGASIDTIKFFITNVFNNNKKLSKLGKFFEDMYQAQTANASFKTPLDISVNSSTIYYITPLSNEAALLFTEIYVKSILKIFLSKDIKKHYRSLNITDEQYRKALNGLISVESVYVKVVKAVKAATIKINDGGIIEVQYYSNERNPGTFAIGPHQPLDVAGSAMLMLVNQFMYDIMNIAMRLDKQKLLPFNYLGTAEITNIAPVKDIPVPVPVQNSPIGQKTELAKIKAQTIINAEKDKVIEENILELRNKLTALGTDSSIAMKLKNEIAEIKKELSNPENQQFKDKLNADIDTLETQLEQEKLENAKKADLIKSELKETQEKLAKQIEQEQANKKELEDTIYSLTEELKSNNELDNQNKQILKNYIETVEAQLKEEDAKNLKEKQLLQGQFDILKTELEQTKQVLEDREESFINKYGKIIAIVVVILLLLLIIIGMVMLMKN